MFTVFLPKNHSIMVVESLGNIIKERRKELGISQPDLAELAQISVNTLTKLERGESNPSWDVLQKVLDVLGLEIIISPKNHTKS